MSIPDHTIQEPANEGLRCVDCDEDCWDVPDKTYCWMGFGGCLIAAGYCPWLMPNIPFPPKPGEPA